MSKIVFKCSECGNFRKFDERFVEDEESEDGGDFVEPEKKEMCTIISFSDIAAMRECLHNVYWLFGLTWKCKQINNMTLQIKYYPPMPRFEFESFSASNKIVPDALCRFDQFYSKQRLFNGANITIIHI